ncbi:Probable RNA-directed DNA polymerase from transposon BS [Eumeta japonica]|uniref:Probable RNA-directed DNA polymerase from transposon BS n=1 Tax=Eumeta variegata TaxID=151549 RepID=A0A4C1X6E6_EUMVA|nr:Probable RNA-directed DNA polymerase from transposon BS [Eumeta japonica]
MEEITPTDKAFWKVTKALKSERYFPTPPLKRPYNSLAAEGRVKAECLADSVEHQSSHILPPHDIHHITTSRRRVWHADLIHKLYLQKVPDRLIHIIHAYINNRHFMFKHENTHLSRRLIREGVRQGSTLSFLLYSAYTDDIPPPTSGVERALVADDTTLYMRCKTVHSIYPYFQRTIDELAPWFQTRRIEDGDDIRVTCFTHAAPTAPKKFQVLQNKFCRSATNGHWCVKNLVLHRNLELPTISKYMKDASERFFSIAVSHPNTLSCGFLREAATVPFYPWATECPHRSVRRLCIRSRKNNRLKQ